ncbi:T-cell surface antigen CD2 [Spea bombifrons]|uniref:T-cell surface antigen CD2 n=1 Tax=Spea bombifrons TaxID=233779 RepID=UPI00234B369E|nr:T-cell surface antigen CD2 [Spea bombifrons]
MLLLALRLGSWLWLWTLLPTGRVTGTFYGAVNGSVVLDVPPTPGRDVFEVRWKDSNDKLMGKLKKSDEKPLLGGQCGCDVHKNGSLHLLQLRAPGERIYTVTTYNAAGRQIHNGTVRLVVIEKVNTPLIGYNCSNTKVRVTCWVSGGTDPEIDIKWDGQVKARLKSRSLETSIGHMGKAGTVTCRAKNPVSDQEQAMEVNCLKVWSLYMILAVVGGGVVFIIFLILLIYCVRLKCNKRRGRKDEEVSITYQPAGHRIQQRQLPEPPTGRPIADPPERSPGQKTPMKPVSAPPAVRGAHRKRPQEPLKGPQPPNNPPQIPSLPLNHPNELPPRQQPRAQPRQQPSQTQPRRKQ